MSQRSTIEWTEILCTFVVARKTSSAGISTTVRDLAGVQV
jgi:hypothetical protein